MIHVRYIRSLIRSASSLAYSLSDFSATDLREANPKPVVSDRKNLERCILLVANRRRYPAWLLFRWCPYPSIYRSPVVIGVRMVDIYPKNPEARRLPNYNGERTAFLQAVVHRHTEVGAGVYICIRIVLWLRHTYKEHTHDFIWDCGWDVSENPQLSSLDRWCLASSTQKWIL